MLFSHCRTNRRTYGLAIERSHVRSLDLLHDDDLLLAITCDREGCACAGHQALMTRLDRSLDVLRVVIRPAKNDQILQPSRDIKFALVFETQIARPQVSFV